MQTAAQFPFDFQEFGAQAFAHALSPEHEPSIRGLGADMREAQEVAGVRPPETAREPARFRESAELDHSGLFRMQGQREAREPRLEIVEEPARVGFKLEAYDGVVRIADDDYVAARLGFTPLLDPEIVDIVQVDICQKGRYHPLNAKGNFTFERSVPLDRSRSLLDLRLKR